MKHRSTRPPTVRSCRRLAGDREHTFGPLDLTVFPSYKSRANANANPTTSLTCREPCWCSASRTAFYYSRRSTSSRGALTSPRHEYPSDVVDCIFLFPPPPPPNTQKASMLMLLLLVLLPSRSVSKPAADWRRPAVTSRCRPIAREISMELLSRQKRSRINYRVNASKNDVLRHVNNALTSPETTCS